MAAAAARGAFIFSRISGLSLKQLPQPPPPPNPFFSRRRPSSGVSSVTVSCLSSGGGVSDDYFVSTRKSTFDRGFSVILKMLKRIEPLDNCVISKGVSDAAKDSMKQTISTMLGLLPSDQFSVTVNFSKQPLDRLIVSSIITGYTLWNAEYRISLMRNFDISGGDKLKPEQDEINGESESHSEEIGGGDEYSDLDLERIRPQVFADLSSQALNYINKLQSQLSDVKEELNAQKQKNMQVEYDRGSRNDLLEYLRSLDAEMVTELSRPSSSEVEEIIHQLVQNVLTKLFKEDETSDIREDPVVGNTASHQNGDEENNGIIGTSRDYLAKLLFWCMLLGHHLRGLENRLHLSCVVGLL